MEYFNTIHVSLSLLYFYPHDLYSFLSPIKKKGKKALDLITKSTLYQIYEIKYFPNYAQVNLVNILVILFLCNKAIAVFKVLRLILTLNIFLGFKTLVFIIDWGKVVLSG